ncbi:MAG: ribonuclease P protein component [Candidatus Kerfeldbacteria bacterium]|nr:ribonuclease P protein component [Candidatus Kerfeldbacteria bacterium]
MLPRANRLRRATSFSRVYQSGRSVGGRLLVVRGLRTRPGHPARAGIVVSTKVSKLATVRNRLRRRLRAAIRSKLRAFPGVDLVVIAKPPSRGQPFAALDAELNSLLSRLLKT